MLGSGLYPEWIYQKGQISFGPTLIPGGRLTVRLTVSDTGVELALDSEISGPALPCRVAIPEFREEQIDTATPGCRLTRC